MRICSLSFFIIIFIFLTNSLIAALDINHPLTIIELVDIALENHPSTRQNWWKANRAASELEITKSAYYPTVSLNSAVKHGKDFKFINGPDTNYTIVSTNLVLSMMLYDFGERSANVNAAKMSLLAANWQVDFHIQKVMVKVLENAYSTLHAQEIVQGAYCSLEDAEAVLNAARELNRTGLSPVSDVYTGQATLSQMKMNLSQQKALLDIARGKLAVSLGLAANISLELATLDAIEAPQNQQIEELIALALRQRGDLMAKQAKLSASSFNQSKARAGYGPKVTLSGSGGAHRALHDKMNAAKYEISLNVSIPIFKGFETVYKNRMAYADTQLAMEDLAELESEILLEVLTHSRSLESAKEMLPDVDEYLKNSMKAYESALSRYKAGKENITQLSHAQQQLASARVKYSDVKTRWLVSMANLAYATGTLTPYTKTQCENNS